MKNDTSNEVKSENKIPENKETKEKSDNKPINSPKKSDKKLSNNFTLSPDNNKLMNQKFFPSKEDFFGFKISPEKINLRSYSPNSNSPIFNYYSMSPPTQNNNIYSPNKEGYNSRKLSYNFNFSPSAIFNTVNTNQNDININIDSPQTLQERLEPFVKKGDTNNFIFNNIYNIRNNETNKENYEEDEEEESNEEVFTLNINNTNTNENNISESNQKAQNINSNDKNAKDNIKQNTNNNNEITDANLHNKENSVKNIIIKKEFKPYIPNKLRNMNNIINYSNDFNQNNIFFRQYENNYINYPQNYSNIYNNNIMNYSNDINPINTEIQNQSHNFYYKGDNYQITNYQEVNNNINNQKPGEIRSITQLDIVTTITSNNKMVKRINPNVYLNESLEFLAFNILRLGQDQAGCRFLQEKIDSDPEKVIPVFFKAIIPYLIPLTKDPFGNYLVQKFFPHLSPDEFKIILEKISLNIFDLGSDNHGTRVIQNMINYLYTPDLVNLFLNIIKPQIIPLLKEMHGVHIINKLISYHPECEAEINKVIVDNCSLLATHKHGCFFLQKILEGPERPLKSELIKNLIDICFVLIIDQFGNYVIQSILNLNNNKYSSDIALIISDNVPYYSKHRYSCNVIEKCFDFCEKKERNILIEKLCTPEVIPELILDEHGNYVIQKALYYADKDKKEEILKIVKPLIPKIKNNSFGDKLLNKLYYIYPELNNRNKYDDNFEKDYQNNWNEINCDTKNKKYKGYQKKKNVNYSNKFNNIENEGYINKNRYYPYKNNISHNNQDININNNNVPMSNIYNINNNTINININSNNDKKEENESDSDDNDNNEVKNNNEMKDNKGNNDSSENKKKSKKKKLRKKKKSPD